MRTLRLSLAWTVIVVLLGGLAGVAVGQDAEEVPVWVKLLTRGDLRIEGMAGIALPSVGFAESIRDLRGAWDSTYWSRPSSSAITPPRAPAAHSIGVMTKDI